ncbi:MAG: excinuclease ABC subunit UvrC [Verrucomicrobia bacterium]|nr:excinuclease ABC subunit UvrC [Verrucomicrobiota bacterium]
MPANEQIRLKLSQVPHKPGVYLMKDRLGTVIYVGKARDLRRRVSQYFHPSKRLAWDPKLRALIEAIQDLDVHVVKSEPEALLLESRLIKQFQPRYNVSFRDDKNFLMLKVNLADPVPRFTLTRLKLEDGSRYFGPFPNSGAIRRTLQLVRRQYNLRGCRPLTPTEADYKHCLYGNLKFCTAPCIGNVTQEQYRGQVQAACDFLSGQCGEMADQLEAEMRKAAAAQDYEKAAQLRDAILDLRRATKKSRDFARLPRKLPIAIQPEKDLQDLAAILGLPAPPDRIEGFDISNISGTLAVASMVSFWKGRPDRKSYRKFRMKDVQGQDDFACIAEAVRRRYSRVLAEQKGTDGPRPEEAQAVREELQKLVDETSQRIRKGLSAKPIAPDAQGKLPDLILIDGGRGQLNAALDELRKLGLEKTPVIGLAKEFEEIYRPGHVAPLRLGLDSPVVKLLQRIRDESHRVANSFNAQLRVKKISESVLDEFPGIGDARKMALLRKFGSVQRMAAASVEQLLEVPGIGEKSATELKAFLIARITH